MIKITLMALAAYFSLLAAALLFAPLAFYETVPGVSDTGPFNSHFVRDVGFAFLVSAAALLAGALRGDRALAVLGAGFPVLHGIFHVVGYGHHSFPSQMAAIGDLAATAGLAAFTLVMACQVKGDAA